MRITDFDFYKDLLIEKSGLYLRPDQSYLLDSRLTPVAKKWGYPSLHAMSIALRAVPSPNMIADIVEALTINDTSFFRDQTPFDIIRESVLPYLAKAQPSGKRTLRIWCAGVATGQEAYSLAILLQEHSPLLKGWEIEILATDLSSANIQRATAGRYSQIEVQRGLSTAMIVKYFTMSQDGYLANENIRRMITFRQHNLLDPAAEFGVFNIILCRNVITPLAYEVQNDILNRLAESLAPDGFLFLGKDEPLPPGQSAIVPLGGIKELYGRQEGRYNMDELMPRATG